MSSQDFSSAHSGYCSHVVCHVGPFWPSYCMCWSALDVVVLSLQDQSAKEKALQSISSMSSAQIVSATAIHSKLLPGIVRASFPGNAPVTRKHTRANMHILSIHHSQGQELH